MANFQTFSFSAVQKITNVGSTIRKAFLTVEDQNIRFRFDQGVPTATLGHLLEVGDVLVLESNSEITNLQMIPVTGTAEVNVTLL